LYLMVETETGERGYLVTYIRHSTCHCSQISLVEPGYGLMRKARAAMFLQHSYRTMGPVL
jgi:hypothetical protein